MFASIPIPADLIPANATRWDFIALAIAAVFSLGMLEWMRRKLR